MLVSLIASVAVACAPSSGASREPAPQCDRAATDSVITSLQARGDTVGAPDVLPPVVTRGAPVQYPASDASSRVRTARVDYAFVIGVDGRIDLCTIRVLRFPNAAFARAGIDALVATEFRPAQRDGHPVAVVARQTFFWRRQ